MQLKDIERYTKTVSVPFDKEEIVIEFLPSVMTSKEFVQAMADPPVKLEDILAIAIPWLVKAIVWWDIYDGETPLAINTTSMGRLPVHTIMRIFLAVGKASQIDTGESWAPSRVGNE